MSAGIAGMHYLGMASMRLPVIARYAPLLVTFSILLAILFSPLALLLAFGLREETRWTVPRRLGIESGSPEMKQVSLGSGAFEACLPNAMAYLRSVADLDPALKIQAIRSAQSRTTEEHNICSTRRQEACIQCA
jgi:hypothetical protein